MAQITAVLRTIVTSARYLVAVLAALALVMVGLAGNSTSVAQQQADRAALPPEQIDQLIAPIALYPDNLLGQILAASTYPLEVVIAARWSAANPNVTGAALEDAMQQQPWDPSVKALAAVPQVLQMMSEKVEWTHQLGDAYLAQPDDIAASVQRLRARADASGNLKDTGKLKVKRVAAPPPPPEVVYAEPLPPEYIIIEPYEPDVLFVPVYDPWVVYGVWPYPYYRPFFWFPRGYVAVGIIGFGAPCIVGAAVWANYNWYSRRVVVNVVNYNKFNRLALANSAANQSWKHDSKHRGNLSYSNAKLQQQYGKPGSGPSQKVPNTQGVSTGKPVTLNNTGKPVTSNNTGKPVTLNNTGKPVTLNNTGKPVTTNNTGKPVTLNNTGKPVTTNYTGKPTTINNAGKPVTTSRTANINRSGVGSNRPISGGQNMQVRQGMSSARSNYKPPPNVRQGNKPY